MQERPEQEGVGETRRSADQPVPNTRAPEAGSPPAAGRVSPAEKSEPSGVPIEEQAHIDDVNAPQGGVDAMMGTRGTIEEGIPASSIDTRSDLGTDEARQAAQTPNFEPPPEAGDPTEGSVEG